MEITGIVKKVGDTETVSEKFKKRYLILTLDADGKYPQHISLQATQDKVVMLDSLPIGSEVKCSINIRGREWTSPSGEVIYFNTLECWKIEVIKAGVTPTQQPVSDLPF